MVKEEALDMSEKKYFSSGTQWEANVGYSRAIRVGNIVEVSGTVAVDDSGRVIGKDDPYTQTRFALKKIEDALKHVGAEMKDVIRTRLFVADINMWQAVGKAHGEFFKDIKPATTMVEISRLIGLDFLIEIEATAVITE